MAELKVEDGLTVSSGGITVTGGATFSGSTAITHNGNTLVNTSSKVLIGRLPTQSTMTNSSSYVPLSSAVMAALVGSYSSGSSGSGYYKATGGIIIQWGIYTADSTGTQTITLPTEFTTSYYGVSRNFYETVSSTQISYRSMSIVSRSTTSFEVYITATSIPIIWIAVGY